MAQCNRVIYIKVELVLTAIYLKIVLRSRFELLTDGLIVRRSTVPFNYEWLFQHCWESIIEGRSHNGCINIIITAQTWHLASHHSKTATGHS